MLGQDRDWDGVAIEMNKQLAIVNGRVYWKSIFGTRRDDYTHEQNARDMISERGVKPLEVIDA